MEKSVTLFWHALKWSVHYIVVQDVSYICILIVQSLLGYKLHWALMGIKCDHLSIYCMVLIGIKIFNPSKFTFVCRWFLYKAVNPTTFPCNFYKVSEREVACVLFMVIVATTKIKHLHFCLYSFLNI